MFAVFWKYIKISWILSFWQTEVRNQLKVRNSRRYFCSRKLESKLILRAKTSHSWFRKLFTNRSNICFNIKKREAGWEHRALELYSFILWRHIGRSSQNSLVETEAKVFFLLLFSFKDIKNHDYQKYKTMSVIRAVFHS